MERSGGRSDRTRKRQEPSEGGQREEEERPDPMSPLHFLPIQSCPILSKRQKGEGWVVGLEETGGETKMRSRENGANTYLHNDFLRIDRGPNKRRRERRIELSGSFKRAEARSLAP